MKPFYPFLLSFILCVTGAVPAFPGVVVRVGGSSSKGAMQQRVRQKLSAQDTSWTHFGNNISAKDCPLYASVKAGLEEYYARKDFADPGRQSGWYRVELFLKWLKRHEAVLKQEKIHINSGDKTYAVPVCQALRKASYKEIFSPRDMQGIFGVWLGARYAAGMFVGDQGVQFPSMKLSQMTLGSARIDSTGKKCKSYIEINSDSYDLVPALNLGLHEGTHLVAWMKGKREALGEWGTYLATVHYALPVKADAKAQTYQGARSFTHNASVQSVSCEQMLSEYAAFALGAFMYPTVREQEFFAFKQSASGYQDSTLLRMLRDLAAIRKDKFFVAEFFSTVSGDELKVLNSLKTKFKDCPAVQKMNSLADNTSLSCGDTRVEVLWDDELFKWRAFFGAKGGFISLAASIAPAPLVPLVKKKIESLSDALGPALDEIPLKEVSWKHTGVTDWERFRASGAYDRLCGAVRKYARDNPSGVPPVPNGYL